MNRAALAVVVWLSFVAGVPAASLDCSYCEAWNREQAPFRIFGNTYYVGPRGLGSILVTSAAGHVLIDGALPQSAPMISRHVQQLGFEMREVKVILATHAHFDHVGGIAELQQLSGAKVVASDAAVSALRTGEVDRSDPQSGLLLPFPGASNVEALGQRASLRVGDLQLSVIHTPGHAPGGTSWHWQACEAGRCLNVVYADSLSAVSDDSFKYSGDERYPNAAADMRASIAAIAAAPCDILISNHPERTGLWSIIDEHGNGDRSKLIDATACERYAEAANRNFEQRLQRETKGGR